MHASDAARIINRMIFRPDWQITATPSWIDPEGTVEMYIVIDTVNSNKQYAPEYKTPLKAGGYADMDVSDAKTREDIYHLFLAHIVAPTHEHEDREFLRDPDTMEAPFHPHKPEGRAEWLLRS